MSEMNEKREHFAEVPGHTLLLANYTKGFYRAVGWIPTTLPLTPAVAVYN